MSLEGLKGRGKKCLTTILREDAVMRMIRKSEDLPEKKGCDAWECTWPNGLMDKKGKSTD